MRIETDSQHYTDIAEAIRDMNGTENTYYPEEMASAIRAIPQETMVHYDGTERIIGTWFGETLYQKSYDLGSEVSIDYTGWTEINVSYPTNCNLIIQVDCTTSGGTYAAGILLSKKSNGKFEMQTTRNGNHQSLRYFTIKYTKSSS